MYHPPRKMSAAKLRQHFSLYHLTRLEADPACTELAVAFTQVHDRLGRFLAEHEAATLAAARAFALRDARDDELDRAVRTFANAIHSQTGNSKRSLLYQKYFPGGSPAVTSAPVDLELVRVGTILTKLQEETDPELLAHSEPLRVATEALRAAIETQKAADAAVAHAKGALDAEVARWHLSLDRSCRDLQNLFPGNRNKVESFFRRDDRGPARPDAEDEGEDESESGAPAENELLRVADAAPSGGAEL